MISNLVRLSSAGIQYNQKTGIWYGTFHLKPFQYDYFYFEIKDDHIHFSVSNYDTLQFKLQMEFCIVKEEDCYNKIHQLEEILQQHLKTKYFEDFKQEALLFVQQINSIKELDLSTHLVLTNEVLKHNHDYSCAFELNNLPFLFIFKMKQFEKVIEIHHTNKEHQPIFFDENALNFLGYVFMDKLWNTIKKISIHRVRLLYK